MPREQANRLGQTRVDYFASSHATVPWPAVMTEVINGSRYAAVRSPGRLLIVHAGENTNLFRNVPVKVKRRAVWYANLFANCA